MGQFVASAWIATLVIAGLNSWLLIPTLINSRTFLLVLLARGGVVIALVIFR
jgi:hypothetical protein